jgi:hypothetical protein
MESTELAFFTTQDLVDEVLRRRTFLGVVVQSEEDYRNLDWGTTRTFKVQFNSNLNSSQASRLLDAVAEYIQGEEYYLDGERP